MMKVSDEHLKSMQELRAHANALAFMIGTARVEHREAQIRLIEAGNGKPEMERYGALWFEYQSREAFFMQKVGENRLQQKAAGEEALRALGLDFVRRELTVDMQSGAVSELIAGKWVEASA